MLPKLKIKKSPFLDLYIATTLVVFIFVVVGALACDIAIFYERVSRDNARKIESSLVIKEYKIVPGDVFSKVAGSLGLNTVQASEILKKTEGIYDLAMIRAGNVIRAIFEPGTYEFQRLEYEIDDENLLVVKQTANGPIAHQVKIKYDIKLTKASGIIESSLYETGIAIGLEDKVIMQLADIFAWDIDFVFDIRKGDEFSFLYEKRYLDGVPAGTGNILVARAKIQNDEHWAIYYQDGDGKKDYYDLEGKCLRRQFLRSPLQYKYISSGYSLRRLHPVWGIYTTHQAIDYAASCGTPVVSVGAGKVIFAGWQNNIFGYTVMVRHNGVYTTRYSHLSGFAKGIRYGAQVQQGQVIGYVGTTGTSTGCHLDYGMKKYGSWINSLVQKFPKVEPVKEEYQEQFNVEKERLLKILNSK